MDEFGRVTSDVLLSGPDPREAADPLVNAFLKNDDPMLLIVVDPLLTGFDAPACTYLYIDKSMQDHGLFQAICRTNRLDGEDKTFGYIVDYKDLFKKLVNEKGTGALQVYTFRAGSQRGWNVTGCADARPPEEGEGTAGSGTGNHRPAL